MRIQMKPETIKRRAAEAKVAKERQRASLIQRLKEKAATEPDGIWAELLAEAGAA